MHGAARFARRTIFRNTAPPAANNWSRSFTAQASTLDGILEPYGLSMEASAHELTGADSFQISKAALTARRVMLSFRNVDRCRVLFYIAANGSMTVNELVRHVRITRSHMYQHVKRLIQLGWIRATRRGRAKAYECATPEILALIQTMRTHCVHWQVPVEMLRDDDGVGSSRPERSEH